MAKKEVIDLVAEQKILTKVLTIRGESVIMDKDLAVLYGIETKVFNQAVKRHSERFPGDFMFTLTSKEWNNLRSQNVTSSWGGSR
jgi:ORF6N domain